MKESKPDSQPLKKSDDLNASNSQTPRPLSVKHQVGDAANNWLARNRSLVLRQTPVWAQSLAVLVISLGSMAVIGGIFIRIDEVVTVQGQLKSIGGTVDVETPADTSTSSSSVSSTEDGVASSSSDSLEPSFF